MEVGNFITLMSIYILVKFHPVCNVTYTKSIKCSAHTYHVTHTKSIKITSTQMYAGKNRLLSNELSIGVKPSTNPNSWQNQSAVLISA